MKLKTIEFCYPSPYLHNLPISDKIQQKQELILWFHDNKIILQQNWSTDGRLLLHADYHWIPQSSSHKVLQLLSLGCREQTSSPLPGQVLQDCGEGGRETQV